MTTTRIKPRLEAKVEGLGKIYRADPPFDQALESLRKFGIQNPISIRDLAYARIKEGRESSDLACLRWIEGGRSYLCNEGSYTSEGFLYLKNKPVLVALNSPLLNLELARQAVESNGNNNYFSTNRRIYERYKKLAEKEKNKSPEKRTVLILPKRGSFDIFAGEFRDNELIRFLFKDQTESYGEFLREHDNNKVPVYLVDKNYVDNKEEESVLTQLNFGDFFMSDLCGNSMSLCYGNVRGCLKKLARQDRKIF